jgi:hypothetical protein
VCVCVSCSLFLHRKEAFERPLTPPRTVDWSGKLTQCQSFGGDMGRMKSKTTEHNTDLLETDDCGNSSSNEHFSSFRCWKLDQVGSAPLGVVARSDNCVGRCRDER